MPNDLGKAVDDVIRTQWAERVCEPQHGKGMGVIINRTRTYAAVIDIAALLAAPAAIRHSMHTVSSSAQLVTDGIVRFVDIRPDKYGASNVEQEPPGRQSL